jgi:hypothetical protein
MKTIDEISSWQVIYILYNISVSEKKITEYYILFVFAHGV